MLLIAGIHGPWGFDPHRHLCLLLIVLCCNFIDAQERCFNPKNRQGICVSIRNCPSQETILKKPRPLPLDDLDFLQRSICGFEGVYPKVCCENTIQDPVLGTTTPELLLTEDLTKMAIVPDPPNVTAHPNLRLLTADFCGGITEPKIISGNRTTIAQFPWMALIAYDVGRANPEFRCGGTVISKRYILTAAHCITTSPDMKLVGVRLGEHDLSKERDCDLDGDGFEIICGEKYQDFGVESSLPHPDYTESGLQNDVGLIRLDRDADFRPINVEPICLPIDFTGNSFKPNKVTITGWGITNAGRRSSKLLKFMMSPVPNEQCAQLYQEMKVNIRYKQLCANGTKDVESRQSDSGGPLQAPNFYNGSFHWIQYGVSSFGSRDYGVEGLPGVYTRITYYLDWILDNIRD